MSERSEPKGPKRLVEHLYDKATAGAIANTVAFTVIAGLAASRAAHGVLSPAGLVAVVVLAAFASTVTGWVAGAYEGAAVALAGDVTEVQPADRDLLARPWRLALGWAFGAAAWAGCGAVVLAAALQHRSAPFPVIAVALVALAASSAVVVDTAARAAGASAGAALAQHQPGEVDLRTRAWRQLALPAAALQGVINAGAAWVLFHGEADAGRLTEGAAFADILLVSAILASLFGALGRSWGAVDAAVGRVDFDPAERPPRSRPFGPQALVYAGFVTLIVTAVARLAVPSMPTLTQVAFARGLIALGLTLLATGFGYVRGALNAEPAALVDRSPFPAPVPAFRRLATKPAIATAAAAAILAVTVLAPATSTTGRAGAAPLEEFGLTAELNALGVRVEYDVPIPAGTGSAPEVVGAVRRTNGGEVANGIAGAPSRLDAVVGGRLHDPDGTPGSGDENNVPQAECAYPGRLVDVGYAFPTDTNDTTAGAPPLGHATAICGAGPSLILDALGADPSGPFGLGAAVSVGSIVGDATAGPVDGVLAAEASARASGISILDGVVTVESVQSRGRSATTGQPGGATTEAIVDVTGITVAGGLTFDLTGGEIAFGAFAVPIDSEAGRAVLAAASAALAPSDCTMAALDSPSAFPQGFLFTRPEPVLGVADDGSVAGSMTGGLLVSCDLPPNPTDLNPQRIQVVLGFAYTSVTATAEVGGFGLDDLAGGAPGGDGGFGGGLSQPAAAGLPSSSPGSAVEAPVGPATDGVASSSAPAPDSSLGRYVRLVAANFAGRPWVWLLALSGWLLLTHTGIDRLRREVDLATTGTDFS